MLRWLERARHQDIGDIGAEEIMLMELHISDVEQDACHIKEIRKSVSWEEDETADWEGKGVSDRLAVG